MLAESVHFDDTCRTPQSDVPLPSGGILRAIRNSAEMSGLDPTAELYNEALHAATDGHLRLARERLHVLLGLAPDDGQARLLLAKVLVAGQRWQESLTALDDATACGERVPDELRHAVEEHLRADTEADAMRLEAQHVREQTEIKALRQEARRLRTENAQLLGRTHDLERETRKWAWTTTAVSAIGLFFVALNVLFSGASESVAAAPPAAEPTVADTVATSPATEALPTPAAPVPAAPKASLGDRATEAISTADGLEGTSLTVSVKDNTAALTGEVMTARQRRRAEQALLSVSGITSVDLAGTRVLARTKGAEHTVESGDTLSRIALQYYGESSLSSRILDANRSAFGKSANLKIGQTLKVPAVD